MKKRSLLLTVLLVFTMFITACGTKVSPFEGKWVGTFDMTDYVMDVVSADENFEAYGDYLTLENLILKVNFSFEGEDMQMSVDEDSIDALVENLENSMYDMMDKMMRDMLMNEYKKVFADVETLDDVAALTNGMYADGQAILDSVATIQGYDNYDQMITETVASINMGEMMTEACASLDLSGTYGYDEETGILTMYYEDNTYEEMQYVFVDDELVIRVTADDVEFDFHCEKIVEE